jgi:hypothetical protein
VATTIAVGAGPVRRVCGIPAATPEGTNRGAAWGSRDPMSLRGSNSRWRYLVALVRPIRAAPGRQTGAAQGVGFGTEQGMEKRPIARDARRGGWW